MNNEKWWYVEILFMKLITNYKYLSSSKHFTFPRMNVSGVHLNFAVATVKGHVFSILISSRIKYASSPALNFLVNSLSSQRYMTFILFSRNFSNVKGIFSGLFLIYNQNTIYAACFIALPIWETETWSGVSFAPLYSENLHFTLYDSFESISISFTKISSSYNVHNISRISGVISIVAQIFEFTLSNRSLNLLDFSMMNCY